MEHPIPTAIASFGMSGQVFHGPILKVNPQFKVTQILERTKNISAKLFPDARIVKSFDELVADKETELIIVNTPDSLHYSMVKKALQAGKHVVVEKPVAQQSSQAIDLVTLAKKAGKKLAVYQNRRWDGDFRTVQKIISEGKLGRLVEFESHYDRYRAGITPDTWKEEYDEFGGVLYNLGSHMIDQAFVLFGKPKAVTAHLKIVRKGGKVNDYYDVRLDYENFSAILKCSYLVKEPGPRYSIFGEKGTFYKWGIDPQEEILKTGELPAGEAWGTEPESQWGTIYYEKDGEDLKEKVKTLPGDYRIFYDKLYKSIRLNAALPVEPEDTIEVLKIIEACKDSHQQNKTITL
ncbi:MAG: oxidoreductase [Draconibacterium sp.]|nr:MAG: oxidoreductase [Draconibacterium sp.]